MYPSTPSLSPARPLSMSHHCNSPSIDLECLLTYSTASKASSIGIWTNPQFRYKYKKLIDQHHATTNYLCVRFQCSQRINCSYKWQHTFVAKIEFFNLTHKFFYLFLHGAMARSLSLALTILCSPPKSCTTWQHVMYLYSSLISCNAHSGREWAKCNYFWRQ